MSLSVNLLIGEVIGTMALVLLGDGVVANVVLNKTKGHQAGWIVIAAGWGFAVAIGAYISGWASGGHLNPAVTLALASIGDLPFSQVPVYVAGQLIGAFLGAVLVWLAYLPHWAPTSDPSAKLGVFCTVPAIRQYGANFVCEVIGTAVLLIGVLSLLNTHNRIGSGVGPYLVGILVFGIGLSLGGPTGYAINPARDLMPRLAHALLPIPGKGSSDWAYAWVPICGPIVGGLLGAGLYALLFRGLAPIVTP